MPSPYLGVPPKECYHWVVIQCDVMKPGTSLADFVRIQSATPIYRYLSIHEFCSLLAGTLRLTCPFSWADGPNGDPWENLLFQTNVVRPVGTPLNTSAEGRKIYAQCWTMTEESDAMWRLYGQGDSVKIKTTAGALLGAAQARIDLERNEIITFKIGAVAYLDEVHVDNSFATAARFLNGLTEPHESTMLKRVAYQHESEVRMVAFDFDDRNRRPELDTTNIRAYPGNPYHLDITIPAGSAGSWIQDAVLNPRLTSEKASRLTDQVAAANFPTERIRQSNLYGRRKITIHLP